MKSKNTYNTISSFIAFIDVLGAKELINENSEASLNLLHECYELTTKSFADTENNFLLKPNVKIFSDNIVISLPYNDTDDDNSIHSAYSLFIFCSIFQFYCLSNGILTRGAITFGSFFQDDLMVLGKGLLRAYELESNVAIYPRIIIDPELNDITELLLRPAKSNFIQKDFDGFYFIELLNEKLSNYWKNEIDIYISENLVKIEKAHTNAKVLQKLNWLHNYLSRKKNLINI